MKTIRKFSSLIVIWILTGILAWSQESTREELNIPLSKPGQPGKLECSLLNGSLTVTGYAGNEVQVVATQPMKKITVTEAEDSGREGLKKISASSFSLSAEEEENVVQISSDNYRTAIDLVIRVPQKFDLEVGTVNQGNVVVENVDGTLEITNVNGNITITGVSGSVITNTVNGTVKVTMNRVAPDTPMSFVTFNGDVDVTLPSSIKASAKFKSGMGDIYTDFDMNFEAKKITVDNSAEEGTYKVSVDEYLNGKVNGGGPEYYFKSSMGDIYFRKK